MIYAAARAWLERRGRRGTDMASAAQAGGIRAAYGRIIIMAMVGAEKICRREKK
ncbi:MAG: hypothetical protein LBG82_04290 [Clostridiales Family XIII bacterium]|jgi:hypothetical protein|nr:hypothetical protein [Clostridiales Family XIII bacterium]